jgi:ferredoxin-NADP reductase/MOSC domain-containing protein YiiM/ferredoxin
MAQLLSVNVGLPRDIEWKGHTVHTGIWKNPVDGRCRVGRLNLDGDGQGDLAGHGGERRAVSVYQADSYRYWQQQLNRPDLGDLKSCGQYGENFTIEGLPDDTGCIGDRYRIGGALFEVTQPRVTCYRLGIRTNEPRMPALLTSSGRPGFYFRVLEEGEVGAGDEIVKVGEAKERMTVAEVNALLYSPNHPRELLERALRIEALSVGWRRSFEAMLRTSTSGNAGLIPEAAAHPAAPGFHPLAVTSIDRESADVLSFTLQSPDGHSLPTALPGQYVAIRLQPVAEGALVFRSYSLSGALSAERYRISVKIEPNGVAGTWLRDHVRVGSPLDVSSPRGSFTLQTGERPIILLSAGIGATPVLAMLHALAATGSNRQVLWLHIARDGEHHAFADEVRHLMPALPHGRSYVCYSRPAASDKLGKEFDRAGRLSRSVFEEAGIPPDADAYLCGPAAFMTDMKAALAASGILLERTHIEIFNGGESSIPGVVGAVASKPHVPESDTDTGPLVSFARSGIAAHWKPSAYRSILELAEACDVPVRWSCRAGVCHSCESGLVSGTVVYEPEPLDRPAAGNVLVCCSQPVWDVVIDL